MELHEFISGAFKLIGFCLQAFWDTLVALFWRGELLEAITPPQGVILGALSVCAVQAARMWWRGTLISTNR